MLCTDSPIIETPIEIDQIPTSLFDTVCLVGLLESKWNSG